MLLYKDPTLAAKTLGQLFKRSLARVQQNRAPSHFQFVQRFYRNIIYREQFQ